MARAYVRDPAIVFADEPSSNLDPANGRLVIHQLKEWLKERPDERSVILVTHDHQLASEADDLIILHKGEAVYGGSEPLRSLPAEAIGNMLAGYAEATESPGAAVAARAPAQRGPLGVSRSLRDAVALAWQEMFAARSDGQMRLSPRRFRQWQSLFSYALLMVLLVGLLYAYGYAEAYFEKEMAHPGVRHVIISGNPVFEETRLTPDLLAGLKDGSQFPHKGIFPRLANREDLYIVKADAEVSQGRAQVEYLVLDPEEDAAGVVQLVDLEGRPRRETLADALKAKDQESGRIAIALHRGVFLNIARKHNLPPAELERRLRLRAQERLIPFDIIGFYDVSVPDRGYVYEGVMSIASHVNFALVSSLKMLLDDDSRPRTYQRAAVYFDVETYRATLSKLSETNFSFSRDSFQKLASLFDVSLQFKALLGLLIGCVSIFALCILFFNALAQMTRVWKSALILLAHGVPAYIFALSVSTQIAFGLGLAAAVCYAGGITIAFMIEDGSMLIAALNQGLALLGAFAAATVSGVLVGVYVQKPRRTALGEQLKSN